MNDPYPTIAPPLRGRAWIEQFWGNLTFIHWPVPPNAVAHFFPDGTTPDVFDGMTYVALVPFEMSATRIAARLPLPYFGTFAETNVRLYSVDDAGRHGVVFLSLETQRLAVVALTRIGLGVPYTWAGMRVSRSGQRVNYASVRRWPRRGLSSSVTVEVGDVVEATELDVWLTARWGAHTRKLGRTWWVPNTHHTWPLRSAEILQLSDELVPADGIDLAEPRLRTLYSPGVLAQFGTPERI